MKRRVRLGLGVLVGLLAAGGSGAPQDEKTLPPRDLQEKTLRHKKDVTRLRGLEFKKEVSVGVYTRAELLDFLKAEIDKELPRDEAERYRRGYAKFGLIPEDLDIYQAYTDLFASSISGFYHPKTKELRLIRADEEGNLQAETLKRLGIDIEAITLVHELTHAAQDQYFELSTLPLEDESNDDLVLALKSVIEGDASAVGWKYAFQDDFDVRIGLINAPYKTGLLPGEANKLPAYLKQTLTFPYGYGTEFVVKCLRERGDGLKGSSAFFQRWPLSTEQILHPSKYTEEPDNPTLVTLPDLAKLFGPPWKESFNNVHGEFAIGILLKEFRSNRLRFSDIRRASEGWDGDRYVVLEKEDPRAPAGYGCVSCGTRKDAPGRCDRCGKALEARGEPRLHTMYVWYSTWDGEQDAREFYEAYCLALEKKYGVEGARERPPKTTFNTAGGRVYAERRGSDVLVLDGATQEMIAKVEVLWKEVKKSEMTSFERLRRFICTRCDVRDAFSGKCSRCASELQYQDEKPKPPEKKRRDY